MQSKADTALCISVIESLLSLYGSDRRSGLFSPTVRSVVFSDHAISTVKCGKTDIIPVC